ncbi:ATP-binding protein [Streptomyces sp. NPDC006193]|uniref:ATP-binding protein n=1 Tax=Streptomyces sp. NPDC006193 TaxID=3155717 RepID=UPI0033B80227
MPALRPPSRIREDLPEDIPEDVRKDVRKDVREDVREDAHRHERRNALHTLAGLRVADNGPGVPPERRRRIFTAGVATERHTGEGHRGLGLAPVAGLLPERGGTGCLTGPARGGAVFTARLPRKVYPGERGAS